MGELKDSLKANSTQLKKRLGQHFLGDVGILRRICDEAGIDGVDVIEIGPGAGTLTRVLAERARAVLAVEIDASLEPLLGDTLAGHENVKLVFADAMKLNFGEACGEAFGHADASRLALVANLPYYITTPILMMALEQHLADSVCIMVQKEVAKRLCAPPGGKEYGAVTVMANYFCRVRYCFDVGRGAFVPPPKVDSAVIKLERRPDGKHVATQAAMRRVVRAAFAQRRKTLSNALKALGLPASALSEAFATADIDPSRRAETLSVDEFERLAAVIG